MQHPQHRRRPSRSHRGIFARLESLEPRQMLANVTVNSAPDALNYAANVTIAQLGATVSLRDAVTAANNTAGNDTITFATALAGSTIKLGINGDNTFGASALPVSSNITIDGGTSGVTISRDAMVAPTRLRFFYVNPAGNLTLTRLTLRDGIARGGNGSGRGGGGAGLGGAIVNAGILNVVAATLTENQAIGGAGGSDSWRGGGGGLGGDGSFDTGGGPNGGTPSAIDGGFGGGGSGVLHFVYENGDGGFGGGAGFINDNALPSSPGLFGGYYNQDGAGIGGAIYNHGGTVNITNSTLASNTTSSNSGTAGGAVYNLNGNVTVKASTLANNTSNLGGAIHNYSTFAATQSGPGLPATGAGQGACAITSSILAGSSNGSWPIADLGWGYSNGSLMATSGSRNIIQYRATNDLNDPTTITADPLLGALASNGGPAPTMKLLGGSPALNAGHNNLVSGLATDQRGLSRIAVGTVDIGAYEHQSATSSFVVTILGDENNGTSDGYFGTGTSLREAINDANSFGGNRTITFDASLTSGGPATITLGGTELSITSSMSIAGPGANLLSISGNNASRVFRIAGTTVSMSGLSITGGSNGLGAGMRVDNSILNLDAVVFTGNNSGDSAAGLASISSNVTIANSTFSNNTAALSSAAIWNVALFGGPASMTIANSTFSGNVVNHPNGGIILNDASISDATLTLRACTIAGNNAQGGGVVWNYASSAQALTQYVGTIFANDGQQNIVNLDGTITSLGHNLSSDGTGNLTAAGDLLNTNPLLGPLANNGGPTKTHALLYGSPAMAAGVTISGVTTDQRGIARHATPDIGAYEEVFRQSLVVTTLVDENNGNADPSFGVGTSLREAINFAQTLDGNPTITFAPSMVRGVQPVIVLGSELTITETMTIVGPGADLLAISGNNASRVFNISGADVVASISGLTITGGRDTGAGGGGIYVERSDLNLDAVVVSGNSAVFGGGLASQVGGTITISNSTFTNNTASHSGGAIVQQGQAGSPGSMTLTNCTISGNVTNGGGFGVISNIGGGGTATLVLRNCTVAGNSGTSATAGAVYNFAYSSPASASYVGTIFASTGTNVFNLDGTIISLGHNLSTDGSGNLTASGDLPNTNPLLGALGNYGGPTPTIPLLPNSPAINSGVAISGVTADQRGIARPQGATPDIGAFERQATSAQLTSMAYEFETRQAITVNFSSDASVTFGRSSYSIQNLTTGQSVPSSTGSLSFNANGTQATLVLTNLLADADYRVTSGTSTLDFFVLAGDANHDHVVDFDDYVLIDNGYNNGLSGFSNGDFNYDGVIDFDDYVLIDLAFNSQ